VGYFVHTDLGDGRTRVRWTYFFQLNREHFPGCLGLLEILEKDAAVALSATIYSGLLFLTATMRR
jgi:hypothetical protein